MTAQEIIVAANAALADMVKLEKELAARKDEIKATAQNADREPNTAERAELARIVEARKQNLDAMGELDFLTLHKLDDSATVQELKQRLDAVSQNLAETLKKVKKTTEFTKVAADVAAGLVKVATGLAGLI